MDNPTYCLFVCFAYTDDFQKYIGQAEKAIGKSCDDYQAIDGGCDMDFVFQNETEAEEAQGRIKDINLPNCGCFIRSSEITTQHVLEGGEIWKKLTTLYCCNEGLSNDSKATH